jgi:hypothetical protein
MWKLHFLFIGPKSAKFQALLILQKEIYIFSIEKIGKVQARLDAKKSSSKNQKKLNKKGSPTGADTSSLHI